MPVKKVTKKKKPAEEAEEKTTAKKTVAKKGTVTKKTGTKTTAKKTAAKTNATENLKKPDTSKMTEEEAPETQEKEPHVPNPATAAPKKTAGTKMRGPVGSVNWPVDDEGQPMVQISFTAVEKIPTGNYANVDVGPATITKFIKDDGDDAIVAEMNNLAEMVEEKIVAEQRDIVHASLKAGKSK